MRTFGKASAALLSALLVGLLSGTSATLAQSRDDQAKLKTLLNSPAYVNKLRFIVSRYEAGVNGCKAPIIAGRTGAKLLKAPVAMPGIGVPKSIQWIDVVRVEGCGKPFRRKVIAALHQGQTVFFPYLAGSTRTTPKLQFDTMRAVLTAERKRTVKAGCKEKSLLAVKSSQFVAEAKVEYGTMWRETWTVKSCKGDRQVGILFSPGKTGKISASIE